MASALLHTPYGPGDEGGALHMRQVARSAIPGSPQLHVTNRSQDNDG